MTLPRFAVFGHPVAHSLSPRIHAAFAEQVGIAMDYAAIDASPDAFADVLAAFSAAGGRGANVTLPYKIATLRLCAEASARARRCGAVNTLLRRADGWYGDNTDGAGLVRDLTLRVRCDPRGRSVLLLGAGGAAAGVAPALLDAGIGGLTLSNRSPARARALVDALGPDDRVRSCDWSGLSSAGSFDLIVNATSAARSRERLGLPFAIAHADTLAIDLGYGEAATDFLGWARDARCRRAIDGLGMLVEQAAEAFELWHGVRPQTDQVYASLRRQWPASGGE